MRGLQHFAIFTPSPQHSNNPFISRTRTSTRTGRIVGRNLRLDVFKELQTLRAMHGFASTVLWIYIVLLVIGGLIGFLKAKSQVSLVSSSVAAAILALCAIGIIFQPYVADIVMGVLLVVFAIRLAKTKKFMPAGMMIVITILALALRHIG